MPGLRSPLVRRIVELIVVGAAYYGVARLGLELALVGRSITPLWAPTGVAVVACYALGPRVWPAIALAAFAVNDPIGPSTWSALGIAAGNTAAPLAGALLLHRARFDAELSRLRDAVVLVVVALVSTVISATVGTTVLDLADALDGNGYVDAWWVWWAGDAMGVLVVAPFLWSWWPLRRFEVRWARLVELVVLFSLLGSTAYLSARSTEPILFTVLPLLVWIAWRFQRRAAAAAALVASVMVILAAVDDLGTFRGDSLLDKMAILQAFNAAVSFTSFFFAAAVAERQRAMEHLYEQERDLAHELQRSLLPMRLPDLPGVAVDGHYVPARRDANVGGDWYDVFVLGDEQLAFVVGDVVGHGIAAAADMAQLRLALRGYAVESESPSVALDRLNHLALELYPELMATVLYARFDPIDRTFWVASAGHLAPVLVDRRGGASYLEIASGPAIGADPGARYDGLVHVLEEGQTVFAFTDGLVERREETIDVGLESLRARAAQLNGDLHQGVQDLVTAVLQAEHLDDVAVLALRPTSLAGRELRFHRPNDPETIPQVRRLLRRWLVDNGADDDEITKVLVAASEAHTNAVRHAYSGRAGAVEISFALQGADVVVSIRDHGRWQPLTVSPQAEGGRGLPIMNALMDVVEIRSGGPGTEISLRLRLAHPAGGGNGAGAAGDPNRDLVGRPRDRRPA